MLIFSFKGYTVHTVESTEFGYSFDGWYDAETGGKRYTLSNGQSVAPFSDDGDVTLYPQFTPDKYTVKLDYGEAAVSGVVTVSARYEQMLPQLPAGLTATGKVFSGWYTKPSCGGIQASAADGNPRIVFNQTSTPFAECFFNRNFSIPRRYSQFCCL